MSHYHRNLRFILFLILPILGFLLGWTLSQKTSQNEISYQDESSLSKEAKEEKTSYNVIKDKLPNYKKINPKEVDTEIFWNTWSLAESIFLYTDEFETQKQVYGATKGLVKSLNDPHTIFMDPEETNLFDESLSGEFEGIGAEISKKDKQIVIITPLKDSPAQAAGLKSGDVVYKVDDESVYDWSIEETITKIRGPKGEKVVLTILREGEKKPIEISIVRDSIILPTTQWEIKNDIAIITLHQFGNDSVKDFKIALQEIVLESPKGIILDLRGNGGGYLDVSIDIISEFLNRKVVLKIKGRDNGHTEEIISKSDGVFLDLPLIILVNEGSASASEILAGAIQDHRRGLVIGAKTFGKGSVQNFFPLPDGSSLKITVSQWLTPNERFIHNKGITPDIEIETKDSDEENDPVIEKALSIIGTPEMEKIVHSERHWEKVAKEEEKKENKEE